MWERLVYFSEWWRQQVARRVGMFGDALQGGMILGALAFAVILGFSPQARELFRILLEVEPGKIAVAQIISAIVATTVFSGLLFFTYQYFLQAREQDPTISTAIRWTGRVMPYLVAAAPWAGCACAVWGMHNELVTAKATIDGLVKVAGDGPKAQAAVIAAHIKQIEARELYAYGLIGAGATFSFLIQFLSARTKIRRPLFCDCLKFVLIAIATLVVAIFGLTAAAGSQLFVDAYTWLGPIATGMVTAIGFLAIAMFLNWFFETLGLTVSAAIGIALCVAIFVFVPSFVKRQAQEKATEQVGSQDAKSTVVSAARDWVAKHKAADNAALPMFVVSAQGGGMYAAIASSIFLSRIHDANKDFNKHLFAISAISGGAIGSALYHSLSQNGCGKPTNGDPAKDWIEEQIPNLLLRDYLGPIVGNLPADLLRKSRSGGVDRSDALKAGLLEACSALASPYSEHWAEHRNAPALVFGTTLMSNAHRVAFAPFSLEAAGDGTLWSFSDIYGDNKPEFRGKPFEPTLADAAVTSARFPGAVPPLSLTFNGRRHNYGDGGYADASGVTTALAIYETLKALPEKSTGKVAPALVMITFDYAQRRPAEENGTRFADSLAPVSAILGVRENLARKAITRAIRIEKSRQKNIMRIVVRPEDYGIALGWNLSRTSYEMLSLLIGKADWCNDGQAALAKEKAQQGGTLDNIIIANSCVAREVLERLK